MAQCLGWTWLARWRSWLAVLRAWRCGRAGHTARFGTILRPAGGCTRATTSHAPGRLRCVGWWLWTAPNPDLPLVAVPLELLPPHPSPHPVAPNTTLDSKPHPEPSFPSQANDVYALINALPAVSLCAYGFITPGLPGSLAFGAGLGITLFGIAYMFVHDGLVHRRFPVGPIAQLPYMRRVSVAHRLHHSEKYGGVPWGLFLGPQVRQAYARHSTAQHQESMVLLRLLCCSVV